MNLHACKLLLTASLSMCVLYVFRSLACMLFELLTGDLLFEPRSGDTFDRNEGGGMY